MQHHVPLVASNSPVAKEMRLAVILAVLSREIDRQIFQPTYTISDDTQLRDILSQLAETDCEKESFCRCMLLSIEPNAQEMSLQSKNQAVVQKVSSYLYELLSETEYSEIRLRISKILHRAIDIWLPIQRAQQRYEPDFEPLNWGDDEWSLFKLPGDDSTRNEVDRNIRDENLLTIFPRISLVENGERFPLTYVTQLRRSQKQCMAAEQEINQASPGRMIGRVLSNRSRRKPRVPDTARSNG